MNIRRALNRQSILAGQTRGKGDEKTGQQERQRWCGSNAILAIVCVVEILHG